MITTSTPSSANVSRQTEPQTLRRLRLFPATTTNMLAMIGIGPFITIPLLFQAMPGPQAMLGWVLGALIALADGLVLAELGATPSASGMIGPTRSLAARWG